MSNKKRWFIPTLIVIIAIILSILVMLFVVSFPWTMIYISGMLERNPPKPEITYAEFPFELVYEINGETITLSDTYVCEFDGFGWNEGEGKIRQWKGYFKSNQQKDIVLIKDKNKEIVCDIGSPEYYMGDQKYNVSPRTDPILVLVEYYDTGGVSSSLCSDQIKEYYKIDLVSWNLSNPIENEFE